ncbi:NitT/TauT family transport system permease protein [Azospirillum lipoferum]|uniref:ABC transporter permease subunit n=1 Tax=Azospirillum lipoferum TaxID=193 RepID=A0A5A9GD22_AZOLI|nr:MULTISPECIES: ABC transporter permease subunit [Azospirillum]KAA0591705.1 ABC transporter permease subunit [Azospirillum lipoferum]MCP1614907.1 NitT/TauT family transport system permease protein [Azospirillum lipoferum]MDW5536342.1 ABC transporter permease subunit [Azospirillum sp. NL1]
MTKRALPVTVMTLLLLAAWYVGAAWLNWPQAAETLVRANKPAGFADVLAQAYTMKRPILPTPDQVVVELWTSLTGYAPTSPRNLLFHAWVTAEAALTGLAMGLLLGILLAAGIVYTRTLEASLLPWVIASQTIPILAIAPMIVVILGNIGLTGLLPKAVICMYLCFFPITVGMVKGLRSADPLWLDLMRTYSASGMRAFWSLRLPASMPFLFASLKVSVAISVVGAIVGELPTGGQAGLGARLLSGSYYGQTVQIWAALIMASLLSVALIAVVRGLELVLLGRAGAR